jgi:hypothetical protein
MMYRCWLITMCITLLSYATITAAAQLSTLGKPMFISETSSDARRGPQELVSLIARCSAPFFCVTSYLHVPSSVKRSLLLTSNF